MGSAGNRDPIITAIEKCEIETQINGGVIGTEIDVVHKRKKNVLVGSIESDSSGPSKIDGISNRKPT